MNLRTLEHRLRHPDPDAMLRALVEAVRRSLGPEPARTAIAVLFVVLMLVFYVAYAATHMDR